jgi:conjugative transposon TraM protein
MNTIINEKRMEFLKNIKDRERIKKYVIFAIMGIFCALCIAYLYAPRKEKNQQSVFNTDIPMPKEGSMINDKREAYEKERVRNDQGERMQSLQDFSSMLNGDISTKASDDLSMIGESPVVETVLPDIKNKTPQSSMQQSMAAYHNINRTLENFYENRDEDFEKEQLRQELEALKKRIEETEAARNSIDDQLELIEKSFLMAAKYMPEAMAGSSPKTEEKPATADDKQSGKQPAVAVSGVREQPVSMLLPEMSNAEFIKTYSQPRNMGFLTATATGVKSHLKNTVSACVYTDQTIMNGQTLRLRLVENTKAGSMSIARGTIVSGLAKLQGERLEITVNSIENEGVILPVELTAYDMDGLRGIFIPNLQEINAAKEIIANMGTSSGTSITFSNDAGSKLAADMGRNLIQGASQFVAKRLREVKVHLKSGYRIYLVQETGFNDKHKIMANNN